MALTVVIAPDSFKGTLSAAQAAKAIARGWQSVRPGDQLLSLPQADGGEGTLDAVESALPRSVRHRVARVTGPDGRPVSAEWVALPDGTAIVELAQTSGLPLMRRLDPLRATTRGMGEVIDDVLEHGATSILIGLGGSASTDGATGALAALGARFLDSAGRDLPDGGGALSELRSVDCSSLRLPPSGGVTLLTDVSAELLGPSGAAAIFAPQKGASPQQVIELEAGLAELASVVGGSPGTPGAGAAGGSAFGLATLWGATITSGAGYVQSVTGLEAAIAHCDVLVSGEGRFDAQSLGGKVVGQLIEKCTRAGVRVGVIAGAVEIDSDVWTASLTDLAGSREAAMHDPIRWLMAAGAEAASALG